MRAVELVSGEEGAKPEVSIMLPREERVPWSGHAATWAIPQLYEQIRRIARRWSSPTPAFSPN